MENHIKGTHTIPVRPGEELDIEKISVFLRNHISHQDFSTVHVEQFPSGASNLTYLITAGDWQAVLRRPPFGPLPPKAHDMQREYALLEKLNRSFPLAPRPYVYSDAADVLGCPFYIMEYRKGISLDSKFPEGITPSVSLCRAISETVVDTMASLHQVDYIASGLMEFGHPDGFMERQVKGWIERYDRAKTDQIDALAPLVSWLSQHIPPTSDATVIHNDYKLNNMLLAPDDLTKVVGIVDWEMATIGDPLFDLAISASYFAQPDDPPALRMILPSVTAQGGFYTREEFFQRYAKQSGRDVSQIGFYMVFAYFKLAVILQQIYVRWKRGQTKDPRFAQFNMGVKTLIEHALEQTTRKLV